ncbi:hypothetical protein CFIO01_00727 [Colletotrichum fioriniae PJ7]|uniref:Uncharacterized protein n=1 Tax=Colletotrichum fioriniae PJ7 TaxID=1445577 RepID=A0A010R4C0_9PEZI|nr:hypothetical protein CFIO01_00727 [Colletotrichum fioriniae PJ7]
MFFSCRAKQPAPPPPRPHCVYSGCVHKVLKCEAPAKAKRILSIFCKDHACRSRTGEKMCTNPKQPGLSKYCEDPIWEKTAAATARAVPTSASSPTQTRTGHIAKATPAQPTDATISEPPTLKCAASIRPSALSLPAVIRASATDSTVLVTAAPIRTATALSTEATGAEITGSARPRGAFHRELSRPVEHMRKFAGSTPATPKPVPNQQQTSRTPRSHHTNRASAWRTSAQQAQSALTPRNPLAAAARSTPACTRPARPRAPTIRSLSPRASSVRAMSAGLPDVMTPRDRTGVSATRSTPASFPDVPPRVASAPAGNPE